MIRVVEPVYYDLETIQDLVKKGLLGWDEITPDPYSERYRILGDEMENQRQALPKNYKMPYFGEYPELNKNIVIVTNYGTVIQKRFGIYTELDSGQKGWLVEAPYDRTWGIGLSRIADQNILCWKYDED